MTSVRITVLCLLLSGCTGDVGPGTAATTSAGESTGESTSAGEATSETPTDTGTPGTSEPDSTSGTPADTTTDETSSTTIASTETSTTGDTGDTTTGDTTTGDTTTGDTTTGGADDPVTQVCMDFCVKYFECFPDNDEFRSAAACTADCSSSWMMQIGDAADPDACEAAVLAFQSCGTSVLCDGTPQDCPNEFAAYQTACQ